MMLKSCVKTSNPLMKMILRSMWEW